MQVVGPLDPPRPDDRRHTAPDTASIELGPSRGLTGSLRASLCLWHELLAGLTRIPPCADCRSEQQSDRIRDQNALLGDFGDFDRKQAIPRWLLRRSPQRWSQ